MDKNRLMMKVKQKLKNDKNYFFKNLVKVQKIRKTKSSEKIKQ